MAVRDIIAQKLAAALEPEVLEVIDESHLHHGHAGWREGGNTHFRVRIATRHFAGRSRIAQHRAVMAALEDELKAGVHALAIEVLPASGAQPPTPPPAPPP